MESSIPGIIILIGILVVVVVALYILDGIVSNSVKKTDTMMKEMKDIVELLAQGIRDYRKDINELSKPENYTKRQELLKTIENKPNYTDNEWFVAMRADIIAINNREKNESTSIK